MKPSRKMNRCNEILTLAFGIIFAPLAAATETWIGADLGGGYQTTEPTVSGNLPLSGGFYNARAVYERRGFTFGELSAAIGFQETWQSGVSDTLTQGIHTRLPMLDLGYARSFLSEHFLLGALARNQFGNGAHADIAALSSLQWLFSLGPTAQYRIPFRLLEKPAQFVAGVNALYGLSRAAHPTWQFSASIGVRVSLASTLDPALPSASKLPVAAAPAEESPSPVVSPEPVDIAAGEVAQIVPEGVKVILPISRVWFEVGDATISEAGVRYLKALAEVFATLRSRWEKLEVSGHADRRGSEQLNLRLSRGRAQKVAQVLSDAGVSSTLIHSRGAGAEEPLADGDGEAAWRLNRRCEIRALSGAEDRAELAAAINAVDRKFQREVTP